MTNSRTRYCLIAVTVALLTGAVASASAAESKLFEAVQPHMGTLFRIKLYAVDEDQAKAGFRIAFARVAQLDSLLSDYKSDSELNRLCRSAVGRPVGVSGDLLLVLQASQKLAQESDGAFDVTLGPVIRLWRQARMEHRLPTAESLREAAARCGYRKLHLDPVGRTVMLEQAGMQLDLGGIGKGYAADAALDVLVNAGFRSALVAASGDLAIGDPPPGKSAWKIGVGSGDRVLEICNAAVSTSGDTEQYVEINGMKYSHIIDPHTGYGLTRRLVVSVVARRGLEADGLSTAVSVLGPERGASLIQRYPGASMIVENVKGR